MRKRNISWWFIPVLAGLIMFLLLRFVYFIGYVPSSSMEPAISAGSYIFGLRCYDQLQVGDIIVFYHDDQLLVKRIAAGSGQTVYIDDNTGTCSVDQEEAHATRMLVVPEGHYFTLGDNLDNSFDSRLWREPFVSEEDVIAVLIE